MENTSKNNREVLNKEIKMLFWATLILSGFGLISFTIRTGVFEDISIVTFAILGLYLFLIAVSISVINEVQGHIENIRKKTHYIFWGTTVCSILLLFSLSYPLFFFFLPYYSVSLLRAIHRFKHNYYDESKFLDKLLKVIEVFMIIILTIGGILFFVIQRI